MPEPAEQARAALRMELLMRWSDAVAADGSDGNADGNDGGTQQPGRRRWRAG
ncbi:hypothetical protein [Streptomyces sp. NPDC005969]|uniref:hypothetical protein n=1 Tax=Streptomyces sp. NPDC005969 TaxID=3156722 RepID=UPI0033E8685A